MITLPPQNINNQLNPYFFYDLPPETTSELCFIPLIGRRATCGLFGISDDFIEEYQSLDTKFIKNKAATFYFKASGDSMEPLIHSGDTLVVDRSISSFRNKICIVIYQDQLICKRVRTNSFQNFALLESENLKYKPIRITDSLDAMVWGVVIARISNL